MWLVEANLCIDLDNALFQPFLDCSVIQLFYFCVHSVELDRSTPKQAGPSAQTSSTRDAGMGGSVGVRAATDNKTDNKTHLSGYQNLGLLGRGKFSEVRTSGSCLVLLD